METYTIVIFLIVAVIVYKLATGEETSTENEHFMGALIQLRAKGLQDNYLTGGRPYGRHRRRIGWMDGYYGPRGDEFIWNNSTHYPKWSIPPYVYMDEYLREYPYTGYYW